MSSDEEQLLSENKSQGEIREELSKLSFEELQKLKDKIGSKMYNETLFNKKEKKRKTGFKRVNHNGPEERSSKKPVSILREVISIKKKTVRDPRFDSLCGTYNDKAFKNSYSFLTDVKKNDVKKLKKELRNTEDKETIKKIKYLIQRLENQLREEERNKRKQQKEKEEKKEVLEAIKTGNKPLFKKKSEKKLIDLVSQYEDLKNSGKLKKHINRIRKKNIKKDRKQLMSVDSP